MFEGFDFSQIALFLSLLFVSISFHETMHAYVAYKLGDDLAHSRGRISLNPLNHIDPFLTIALPAIMLLMGLPPILVAKPVPINPNRVSGEEMGLAVVGLAGPASNLLLATVASLVFRFAGFDGGLQDAVLLFIQLNVALFVFNMIPLPPLDGSRLLYAFAPSGLQRIMDQIERMGILLLVSLIYLLSPIIGPVLITTNNYILRLLLN